MSEVAPPQPFPALPLAQVAARITDGSHFSPVPQEQGHLIANVKDMKSGQIDFDNCTRISDNAFRELEASGCVIKKGDVLLSKDGTVGRVVVYNSDIEIGALSSICLITPLVGQDARFLGYALSSHDSARQYENAMSGSALRRLVLRDIRQIRVPVPTAGEQTRVAQVLDTLDTTIRQTEAIIEKLKQVKQGLLQDLLTRGIDANGELRPPQSQAPQLYKESPLGWIPREWNCASVRDAGTVQLGRQRSPQHERGRYLRPYLRVANVFDGLMDVSDVYSMNFTPSEQEVFSVLPGDIFLNEGQSLELVGRCAIYRGQPGVYCFQNSLVRFRCSDTTVPEYARAVFKRWLDMGRFMQVAKQTTSMAHLGAERFAAMSIALPDLREQELISEMAHPIEARIVSEECIASKLRTLKSGLMDDLLTGRVRVTPLLPRLADS